MSTGTSRDIQDVGQEPSPSRSSIDKRPCWFPNCLWPHKSKEALHWRENCGCRRKRYDLRKWAGNAMEKTGKNSDEMDEIDKSLGRVKMSLSHVSHYATIRPRFPGFKTFARRIYKSRMGWARHWYNLGLLNETALKRRYQELLRRKLIRTAREVEKLRAPIFFHPDSTRQLKMKAASDIIQANKLAHWETDRKHYPVARKRDRETQEFKATSEMFQSFQDTDFFTRWKCPLSVETGKIHTIIEYEGEDEDVLNPESIHFLTRSSRRSKTGQMDVKKWKDSKRKSSVGQDFRKPLTASPSQRLAKAEIRDTLSHTSYGSLVSRQPTDPMERNPFGWALAPKEIDDEVGSEIEKQIIMEPKKGDFGSKNTPVFKK